MIDANTAGVFLGMRAVAPAMTERRMGSIINVSPVAGLIGPRYQTAYAASMWAVRGMTKVVAKELDDTGVRVNSVHPGQIDTDMNARQRESNTRIDRQADPEHPDATDRYSARGGRRAPLSRL